MADLTALAVVAEEKNFTCAATKLGLSQSALSQIVRRLEARLGVRLLSRTTRRVAPTEAGDQLVNSLVPMLRDIDQRIRTSARFVTAPPGSSASLPLSTRPRSSCCLLSANCCRSIPTSRSS